MSIDAEDYSKGFSTYRFNDNPKEERFAQKWVEWNERTQILKYLISPDNKPKIAEMSERDKFIAGKIIQWLGSPVGQGFLEEATTNLKEE